MARVRHRKDESRVSPAGGPDRSGPLAAGMRPTEAQWRYLERGLTQAGGKLPLFDRDGREVPKKTIESCVAHGWAVPWANNPINPDWLVCRLSQAGYRVLGQAPPAGAPCGRPAPAAAADR